MLISINNTIIDTQDIYKVDKILYQYFWCDDFEGGDSREDITTDIMRADRIIFQISLYNTYDKITIVQMLCHGDDESRRELLLKKISLFRQQIIEAWNHDKRQILEFNYE